MSSSDVRQAVPPAAGGFGEDASPADKAAFAKALLHGIVPGSDAARSVERKKSGASDGVSARDGLAQAPMDGHADGVSAAASHDDRDGVEILRRIPAREEIVETAQSAQALHLAAQIEEALEAGNLNHLQPHAQQALLGALCRLYVANHEKGHEFGALGSQSKVTATDVMVMCGALLEAVDLQVFELGLWQSWRSR